MTAASLPATNVADASGKGPRTDEHDDALDGIRTIAAFGVLVLHIGADTGGTLRDGPEKWLLSGGAIAVTVFFTLSGLLLFRPWVVHLLAPDRPKVSVRGYYRRRALRILPAYWVLVTYVMIVLLRSHIGDVWTWLKLLTLTYTYDPTPWWGNSLGPEGLWQIWSLAVEVAWYVVLPVTAYLLTRYARLRERGTLTGNTPDVDRRAKRLLCAIAGYAALSFIYSIFMFHPHYKPLYGVWLPRYLAWFAIGMALAVVAVWARTGSVRAARFGHTIARSWATCWLIAAVMYGIAASPLSGPADLVTIDTVWTSEFRIALYGLVAVFFIAPVALAPGAPVMRAVLGNAVMRFLGRISYGVFLWQVPVLIGWSELTGHTAFTGGFVTEFPVIGVLTTGVATVSFSYVEQPILRLASRRWRSAERDGEAGDHEKAE